MKKHFVTFLISISSALLGVFIYIQVSPKKITTIIEKEIIYSRAVSLQDNNPISSYDFVSPSKIARPTVVLIKTKTLSTNNLLQKEYKINNGSGVILSHDGYIITNNHVIGDADIIEVILDDNRAYDALLVGKDLMTDLALLKIEADGLSSIKFGDSDQLEVGEWVLAIGNPFKLQSTITAGIVSAKARNINLLMDRGKESFIQTDAAVNPGNSGGALVDKDAKLVGIITAILSKKGNYEGFSFAVPSNLVKKVVDDIKTYGAVQRAWMGVTTRSVNAQIAKDNNMDKPRGVYVDIVSKNSAAYDANIKNHDIILRIDQSDVNSVPQITEKLAQYHPGDQIEVLLLRNNKTKKVKLTLKNQINSTDFVAVRKDRILQKTGFELRKLDQSEQARLGTTGVKVISIYQTSIIGHTNMEVGFIIQKVNDKNISSVDELISILKSDIKTIKLIGIYENYPGIYPYSFDIK